MTASMEIFREPNEHGTRAPGTMEFCNAACENIALGNGYMTTAEVREALLAGKTIHTTFSKFSLRHIQTTMTQERADDLTALLFGVQKHCRDNYTNGWCDIIIETLTDGELADIIKNARTLQGAIRKARQHVGGYAEQRRAVQNEIF